ncbi:MULTISPECIES: oxidoreductase [unclassified Variovorax]|jgi:NAD(P)-dependent dehydrogenase (short-subunit alcohol dehydrogenase family)|uniref:oxidoreductase n=1 Tax=unclassified Variovorax TaxID=663243 RepID=UPI000F7E6455|nr:MULTISPECIES: oxidoreductase [unclassified Variovorax]RSZ45950.1 SDR family NAD(P)-dependent oxidoreductase [Variovorax sp. 553]RSZ46596.1 SDR family NAD(P)-dependent oxidoreductase [Variovorax sp. 679]
MSTAANNVSQVRKTWFITGAASGFGRAFAEHALARGHNVVATARDAGRLADLVALAPDRVLATPLDVDAAGAAEAAVQAAVERFGRIDVLVNNAGYGVVGALEETPDAELRALMNTNFFGAMAVTRAALPVLRAQKSGAIVNISSLGGQLSFSGFSAYSASKFALEGASEALAQEVAPFGIKVLIVEPGQFRTQLAGSGMRHMPVIEAYQPVVGATREFAHSMHNTQAGDPRKAAMAIEKALDAEHTPLRLQLGDDSVDAVRAHAQAMLKDMEAWESVSRSTNFDAA